MDSDSDNTPYDPTANEKQNLPDIMTGSCAADIEAAKKYEKTNPPNLATENSNGFIIGNIDTESDGEDFDEIDL